MRNPLLHNLLDDRRRISGLGERIRLAGLSRNERKFLSDKVYRRDDRGVVGVESFSPPAGTAG